MNPFVPQDFGDWISPILVKELRQGLRTRIFTGAFIALQTILLLFMLAGVGENTDEAFITGAFWFLLYVTLLMIMPLRGLNALSSEVKHNTLDLLALTRLDALRICFGKWAALFTQALLFAVAVLPYVVLRYFFGGIDLVSELGFLGAGLVLSAVLCAVSLALSSLANALTRSLLVAGFVFVLFSFSGQMFVGSLASAGFPTAPSPWIWVGLILLAVFVIYFCISAAATRIGPPAQNCSTLRRVLALAGMLLALILAAAVRTEYLTFTYFFLGLIAVDALTEEASDLPSVQQPILRLGVAGRPLLFLLSPGWYSGTIFVTVLLVLIAAAGSALGLFTTAPDRILNIHLALAGVLLLPVLLTQLTLRDLRDRFTPYFFVQVAQLALGGFFMMLGSSARSDSLTWLGSPLPSTSLFMALSGKHGHDQALTSVAGGALLLILVTLLRLGRPHARAMAGTAPPGSPSTSRVPCP